jgi:predicted O-methyltransferase YrrM
MNMNSIKRRLLQIRELYGIKAFDLKKQAETLPHYTELSEKIKREHADYVQKVSSPEMAMSLELALFLLRYCLAHQPKHLLDLGSGFSSYVFRLYREAIGDEVIVYSVDDHAEWLEKTRHYLENAELNTEHLYELTALQGQHLDGYFDLVLLDLNFVEVRKDYIAYSAQVTAKNGIVIIDDVHKVEFLREVKRHAAILQSGLRNIRKQTLDTFGRFAIVLQR